MQKNKNINGIILSNIRIFGNLRVMVASALFVALSIVFGKYLAINPTPFLRISFESLPILMGGIFFGPLVGACIAATADIVGSLMVGYAINPIITLGAISIGFFSGLISLILKRENIVLRVSISAMTAHIIGSMVIKSLGLHFWYDISYPVLAYRIPLYVCIGIVETFIISLLLKNKIFYMELDKIRNNNYKQ